MKTLAAAVPPAILAAPALADPGHLAAAGGHSHWLALAAVAAAGLIAGRSLLRALAGRRAAERRAPK